MGWKVETLPVISSRYSPISETLVYSSFNIARQVLKLLLLSSNSDLGKSKTSTLFGTRFRFAF
jgi:hypothetical protein